MSLDMRQSPAEIYLSGSDTGDISIKLPVRPLSYTLS